MDHPFLGFGLGLRNDYYDEVIQQRPSVDWFEVLTENYMVPGGKPLYYLDKIREHYPMVMHGVSLSIGSTDPLDRGYLKALKQLILRVQPHWVSDHLCWTGVEHTNSHDLLPLPYNESTILHVVERIKQVQDYLGQQILIENLSSYVTYCQSEMTEWEFLNEIARRSDCFILLDINNIYVSARNHHFQATDYLQAIDLDRVRQFHLAGHSDNGEMIIDTHDQAIVDPVWQLYKTAIARFGAISTMIERDDNMPPLSELMRELGVAKNIARDILGDDSVNQQRMTYAQSA